MGKKVNLDLVISWLLAFAFIIIWVVEKSNGTPIRWLPFMTVAVILMAIEKTGRWIKKGD